MDDTTLNPKTGQKFCENFSRHYFMVRGHTVLAEHLKQKLLKYGVQRSYLELTSQSWQLSPDTYRENSDRYTIHLSEVLPPPIHVKNRLSKEVYEFAVKNPEVNLNKLRVCGISAKGKHSCDYGLIDLGCSHHNHEKKEY